MLTIEDLRENAGIFERQHSGDWPHPFAGDFADDRPSQHRMSLSYLRGDNRINLRYTIEGLGHNLTMDDLPWEDLLAFINGGEPDLDVSAVIKSPY